MIDLEQFKDNAKEHGICGMLQDWENAKSKKQLMDIALSIRGIEYLSAAIAQGWGISPDIISRDFAPFLNGRYVRDCGNGYTAAVYCKPAEDIHVATTVALVIDCDKDIYIDRAVCELHIVGSKTNILGKGRAVAHLYGSEISNSDTSSAIIKEQI